MTKGHTKGSAFERQIAKELSLWWSNGLYDDWFWRSTTSGARATQRGKQNQATFGQYGDIQATHPKGRSLLELVVIEIKRGYNHTCIYDMLDAKPDAATQIFEQWILQVTEECLAAEVPYWFLITKRDRRNTMIFLPSELLSTLCKISVPRQALHPYSLFCFPLRRVYGLPLDVFFQVVKPHHMETIRRLP